MVASWEYINGGFNTARYFNPSSDGGKGKQRYPLILGIGFLLLIEYIDN